MQKGLHQTSNLPMSLRLLAVHFFFLSTLSKYLKQDPWIEFQERDRRKAGSLSMLVIPEIRKPGRRAGRCRHTLRHQVHSSHWHPVARVQSASRRARPQSERGAEPHGPI